MGWNQASTNIDFEDDGDWHATMSEKEWSANMSREMVASAKKDFEGEYGDRRIEIVWIGDKERMNELTLRKKLEQCLVTPKEFAWGPKVWAKRLEDPYPDEDEEEQEAPPPPPKKAKKSGKKKGNANSKAKGKAKGKHKGHNHQKKRRGKK